MLSLLLAFLVTTPTAQSDPVADSIQAMCDTPRITEACHYYLQGFLDAMLVQEQVIAELNARGIRVPKVACFQEPVSIEVVRQHVLRVLRIRDREIRGKMLVLAAISKMYECR